MKTIQKTVRQKNEEKTIEIGIEAARMLTDIDAGQTVVVKDESVVALEGIEGTDKVYFTWRRILQGKTVSL